MHEQFSTVYETPDMISYSQIISWLDVLNKGGVLYQSYLSKKPMCQLLFYQGFSGVIIGIWGWEWGIGRV